MDIKKQEEIAKEYGIHPYKIRFVKEKVFMIDIKTYEVLDTKYKNNDNTIAAVRRYFHNSDKEKLKSIIAQINSSIMTYILVNDIDGLDNKVDWKLDIRSIIG